MTPPSDSIEALEDIVSAGIGSTYPAIEYHAERALTALSKLAREAERERDELREAVVEIEDMLDKMGCLSEGANCEIRRTDNPCPRCAALARLAAESTLKSSIGAVGR